MTFFFDFNGTILDDLELTYNILNEMLVEEGHKEITLERYLDIFDFPIKDYYIKAGFDFKNKTFEELAKVFIEKYQPRSLNLKLHDNLISTVLDLKSKGHEVIVLSASKHKNLVEQLKHYNIYDLFDDVLGISDIYAASKVDLATNYVEKRKINNKEIVVIGDTLHDKEVADKLNARMIYYTKGHQAKYRLKDAISIDNYNQLEGVLKNG